MPTSEFYSLSLHDALPICLPELEREVLLRLPGRVPPVPEGGNGGDVLRQIGEGQVGRGPERDRGRRRARRSEEHTSELQSRQYLVCRLLLEKKKEETNR